MRWYHTILLYFYLGIKTKVHEIAITAGIGKMLATRVNGSFRRKLCCQFGKSGRLSSALAQSWWQVIVDHLRLGSYYPAFANLIVVKEFRR
jgi:hypothetical protein